LNIAIIVLGQIVGRMEKWTRFDSLYWSYITATTVGYGDIRPLKKISRLLSVFIAFIGMIFTGILVAIALYTTNIAIEKHIDENLKKTLEKAISINS
jgi:voltage-gated potassium channel